MRVVAGSARGRRLQVPPGTDVRPTSDRVREAVCNALGSLGVIDGARVLDLFAGTGALGIEALSRGAAEAVFVERDRVTAGVVRANLARCALEDRSRVVVRGATSFLAEHTGPPFDLVFCDPPYAWTSWPTLLEALVGASGPDTLLVLESDRPVDLQPGWRVEREKRYGSTLVVFARPPSPPEPR